VDLVAEGAAGVVFHDTEVIDQVVLFGTSDDVFELACASLSFLLLLDDIVGLQDVSTEVATNGPGINVFELFVIDTRRLSHGSGGEERIDLFDGSSCLWAGFGHARKLESVLNGLAHFSRVATFGDFGVVGTSQESIGFAAIGQPEIHNGNLGCSHALCHKVDIDRIFDVLFFKTLGFSEGSGVVLGEDV